MEERNTTELSGEELIHAIVTEVEQLQSEQFGNTTATFDSLLPNYGTCNIVYVEDMLAESGPEIAKFHLVTGLDDTASSDCDIRLQQTMLKPLDSFRSNFVGRNCDEINPIRNDSFGVQEKSTESSAELVAIQTQLHQQQENNSSVKIQVKQQHEVKLEFRKQLNILTESHRLNSQVEQEPTAEVRSPLSYSGQVDQRPGIETVRSHTEECNERIVNAARSKDDVTLYHEPVGSSAQPMSLFQDDNINQSDRSLRTKQVSSVRTAKVDGKRFTFELHSTDAPPKNRQSSRAGSKLHFCAECKKQFVYKSLLTKHFKIHTGEKPFECDICNFSFSHRYSLKKQKRIHSGEKPYKCQDCDAAFSYSSNLKTHQRIHSDDRPFMCIICKKSFRQKINLSRHMDIHSGRTAHKCNVCEKEFRHGSSLTRHFEIHLKKEPSQL